MGLRLALFPFIEAQSLSFVLVCVCYESTKLPKQSQPSIGLTTFSAIDGVFGLCDCQQGRVIGVMGCGKWYGESREVWSGFGLAMAEIGCNWARIGPSKSSQSLSNAHKWAAVID
ncbi:hypothetical protein Tco_1422924 [Tanacetum coccineum]